MYVPQPHLGRVHAHDYNEFRAKYAPWAPDTRDVIEQETLIKLYEPSGARGDAEDTGTLLFGRLFFPRAVRKAMTKPRRLFVMHLDDARIPFLSAKAHRTFSKSTWAKIFAAKELAMRFAPHLLYTSSEYKLAKRSTDWIQSALTSIDFKTFFGDMRPKRAEAGTASFSEDAFFLMDPNTRVPFALCSPRGSGNAVNGSVAPVRGDFVRVTHIINDDGQSRKNIHNAFIRQEYEDWLEAELFQTVETDEQPEADNLWPYPAPGERAPWRVIELDTPKHRLAAIEQHFTQDHWVKLKFPLMTKQADGTYKSAHEIMSDAAVNRLAERLKNKPDYLAREFRCEATSDESKVYTRDMFLPCNAALEYKRRRNLIKFLTVDPSRIGTATANPTSILAWAVDLDRAQIILHTNLVDRWDPEVYYQKIFELCRLTGTTKVYMEDSGLSGVLHNAIKTAAGLAGVADQIEFAWISSKRHPGVEYGSGEDAIKVARAGAPLPYCRQKAVLFDESIVAGPLVTHLLEYPECSEWGPTDTFGYCPEIMELEEIILESDIEGAPIDPEQDEEYEAAMAHFGHRPRLRKAAA